jgi:hypothetical protein
MEGTSPRFERRAWAPAFPELPDPAAEQGAEEIYLLRPGRADFNLKLRDGRLELKELVALHDGLQQWRPTAKLEFPLPSAELGKLDIEPPAAPVDYPSFEALRPVLERAGLVVLPLCKRRRLFERAGCRAETALVEAAGRRLATAAVEDVDPERVRRAAVEMGLDRLPNRAYPAVLLDWFEVAVTG